MKAYQIIENCARVWEIEKRVGNSNHSAVCLDSSSLWFDNFRTSFVAMLFLIKPA